MTKPFRVACWGTGTIGISVLEEVILNPNLELVGLHVFSDWKDGKDAAEVLDPYKQMLGHLYAKLYGGEIVTPPSLDRTGILATSSAEDILALDADVVLYLPINSHDRTPEMREEVMSILRAGKNVITTVGFSYPQVFGNELVKELEEACQSGGSTLMGTGVNPGVIGERIVTAVSGICAHVHRIQMTEYADVSNVPSKEFVFDLMGTGKPIEYFDDPKGSALTFETIFREVVGFVGHAMGIEFDEIRPEHEFATAKEDVKVAAGIVPAGTVVNFRRKWHGMRDGEKFITIEMVWLADPSMEGWGAPDGWEIDIEGKPSINVKIGMRDSDREIYPAAWTHQQYTTGGPVINAIPEVVKAAPGILLPKVFAPYKPVM